MLAPNTRMGPVTLKVADLSAQTRFYRDVVGLQVRDSSNRNVELGTAARPLVVLQHLPTGRFVRGTAGLYHLALRVPSPADMGHWLQHYIAAGSPNWQGASDHGVSVSFYLADAEGNGIEITADTPQETWQHQSNGQLLMYVEPLDVEAILAAAPKTAWAGLAPDSDMGHVHLQVTDLIQAREFYVDLLGFDLQTVYRNSAMFVSAGGYHHHLGMNIWHSHGGTAAPADAYGLAAYTIEHPNATEQQQVIDRLRAAGHTLITDAADTLVRDPSGNLIRLAVNQL